MTAFPLLSDEQIKSVAHAASKVGLLSWLGYEHDDAGFYTVPTLSPCHYQLARAIESESRAPLLAEIERLTREVENVRSEGVMACKLAEAKTNECIALRGQVERLKADAERYRWMRNRAPLMDSGFSCSAGIEVTEWGTDGCGVEVSGDALDAAIDAARAQGGEL